MSCLRLVPLSLTTPSFHCDLPELECLFWGQYFSSSVGSSAPKAGIHMVTQKWSPTLQELDIANQLFTTEDLGLAMSHLAQGAGHLRSLNLSGTRITPAVLRCFPQAFLVRTNIQFLPITHLNDAAFFCFSLNK